MKITQVIRRNKIFSITILILIIGAGYYLWLHRKPYTQNAYVVANIRPVKALVPGYITKIWVKNNQKVKKGDKLFRIYREPYRLTVEKLKNQYLAAILEAEKIVNQIDVLKSKIIQAQYEYENTKYLSGIATRLARPEAVSRSDAEVKLREMQSAQEQVYIINKEVKVLEIAHKLELANIKVLKAEYDISKINLEFTIVYARTDGTVTNMFLTNGIYVDPGDVLFALIDSSEWWVQANFKETELSKIGAGQKAKIWLWQYPGKTFHGTVTETGWGVNRNLTNNRNGLSEVEKENEWFLLPQRFPVQIKILDPDPKYPLHPGGSAFVQVDIPAYTLRHLFWTFFQI